MLIGRGTSARTDLVTHRVGYENLQLTITERGTLEAADNRDVYCRVKARSQQSTVATTIKWVIDDGSQVKQGQLLVELDDSGLYEQQKNQKITLDKARSEFIQAEENLKITESQNETDIKTAEIAVELAKLDLEKYIDGEYEQSKKDIKNRILQAESDLEQWRDRTAWSGRMVKRGYVASSQYQSEMARLQGAEINLDKVREELRVLEKYTFVRTKTDLTSKVAETLRALDRVRKVAESKRLQSQTDLLAKKSIFEQENSKYQELDDEIRKCTLTAPQEGMVVYYIPEQSRSFSGSQQSIVAQGEPCREGQKLMRIPDLRKMLVNTKVHEALVSRVKGEVVEPTGWGDYVRAALMTSPDDLSRLVSQFGFAEMREKFKDRDFRTTYPGQPALIRIDAFPDRVLKGHVKTVATVASQGDWMSADVKTYQTMVSIDEQIQDVKPGMSAEVTIFASRTVDNVLTVPVQAVLGTPAAGAKRKCFVLNGADVEERDIVVGMSNDKMAEIREGLEVGEEVILNPRVLLGDKSKLKPGGSKQKAGEDSGDQPVADKKGGPAGEWKKGGDAAKKGAGESRKGGGEGGGDMEERRKQGEEFMKKMRSASPAQRKQMLEQVPEAFREKVRETLKGQGVEVAP